MKVEQIYTGCLAQGSYYIESNGEAAVIDPLREVDGYIALAKERGANIKYVFETHFHADFVSGHVTLSRETGAPIVFGPGAKTGFDALIAEDNQEFKIGNVSIMVLHTPGHTLESSCYLLNDENGTPHSLFSGDTLFLGDVGRPDLAQKSNEITQDDLAGMLYDSLRNKVMVLPDDTTIYPGHGAGSACGKNMSKETVGKLGEQKETNYALRADMTKEEFIKEVTDGLAKPPAYFPDNVRMNKSGYEDVSALVNNSKELSTNEFKSLSEDERTIVLDVRTQFDFVEGFIPGSIFIGINGGFAPWVGAILKDVQVPILLVAPEGKEDETITRLSRVGFDNVLGYLKGGFDAWKNAGQEIDTIESVSVDDYLKQQNEDNLPVFDVRKDGEYQSEYVLGAKHTALSRIEDHLGDYPSEGKFFVHCAGGYRSVIAASILKRNGIANMIDVKGGFGAMKKAGVEVTEYVCPSTLS